jgi:hypothetical protein
MKSVRLADGGTSAPLSMSLIAIVVNDIEARSRSTLREAIRLR